ncbi:response regulator transcription factor [Neolewinella agarilytica]|uniref:response regulator transcription factor n=1 Tax=Neolewinella agarilytica TaxID=478744 RepID=UPI0015872C29|nr:helix-turn-helix transcriptional regulator [Neolewinella agarilytica]
MKRIQEQQKFAKENAAVFASLTRREREILTDWASGKTNDAIAEEHIVSPHTIRTHRQNVRAKLRIHHTVEAVWWAQCFDLV